MIPMEMPEHIKAIDALNSFVRSDAMRQGHLGAPLGAIYFLKREAIQWADENLVCQHENVRAMVTCRQCGGSGRYIDSMGYRWPHCRACGSRGRHALNFVETRIQCGPTWHSPFGKFWIRGKESPDWRLYRSAHGEWQPNQKGKDLSPDQVAHYLNIAESFWTKRPGDYWTDWGGPFNDFKYRLFVGKTPNRCTFCGYEPKLAEYLMGYGVSRGRICWSDYACKNCAAKRDGGTANIFDQFPIPQQLINFPSIQLWIERNNGLQAPERKKSVFA